MSERTNPNAPRIVQVLDGESARTAMRAAGLQPLLVNDLVALGSDGQLYRWGAATPGEIRRDWHRLPLPPLPEVGER